MSSRLAAHRVVAGVVGSAAVLLSFLPGASLLTRGVWAPPGQESLYAATVSVVGALTLLLLPLYRVEIGSMPRRRVVRLTTGIAMIGFAALFGYSYLSGRTLYRANDRVVHVPAIRTPELKQYDESDGMPRAVELETDAVEWEARSAPGLLLLDNAAFLLLYLIIELAVVSSLTIAAWRLAMEPEIKDVRFTAVELSAGGVAADSQRQPATIK